MLKARVHSGPFVRDVRNLHPLPFYITRQTWMATTGPPERMDWLNKEIRSFVWWVNDPCICLPPAILAHVDCAFLSCPELNQKYCYIPGDSIANLIQSSWGWWFGQDGADFRLKSSCSFMKIATRDTMTLWFDNRTDHEGIGPSRVGMIMLTCSFHFSHCRHFITLFLFQIQSARFPVYLKIAYEDWFDKW